MGNIDLNNMGLSGRIGPMVAYTVNGKQRFRTYVKPNNPQSAKQTSHRNKFAFVSKKISPLFKAIKAGYNNPSLSYGTVCGKVMREAVTGESPDYRLNYDKIQIAEGKLPLPVKVKIQISEKTNVVNLSWSNQMTPGHEAGSADDRVRIVCYNEVEQELLNIRDPLSRSAGKTTFQLPEGWQAEDSHFWIYLQSNDLQRNSNSLYAEKVLNPM